MRRRADADVLPDSDPPSVDGTVPGGLPSLGRARSVEVAGTTLAWVEAGQGPPLVLIHGLADWHRTWRRVSPLLAPHFRLLMVDLPGHGRSGRPDEPYSLDWYASVLDAWMEAIGLRRAHFCGHSYGGGVAQWMVLRHGPRVDRLALVCAGGLGREVTLGLRLAALPIVEPLCTPSAMRLGCRIAMTLDRRTFGNPETPEIEALAQVSAVPGSGRAFARTVRGVIGLGGQFLRTCREAGGADFLPPIALFWGEDDAILPVIHARSALERFEGATLSLFPGAGHFPHLQAPERFAAELTAFLTDPERAPATVRFACPGSRVVRPGLPFGRCASCTWRGREPRDA